MSEWKPEEITAHLDYYAALSRELVASGELVGSTILTGPDLAKIVTSDGTAPVRSARTCWNWPATPRRRPSTTPPRPPGPRTCRSGTSWPGRPPGSEIVPS